MPSARIVVVDDELGITTVIKLTLENEGFVVDAYNDPKEVLAAFKRGHYDLLITDIKMPVMSGFDLYREIKKIDDKISAVFITAFEDYENEALKAFLNLKNSLIRKPFEMSDLVSSVREELDKNLQEQVVDEVELAHEQAADGTKQAEEIAREESDEER